MHMQTATHKLLRMGAFNRCPGEKGRQIGAAAALHFSGGRYLSGMHWLFMWWWFVIFLAVFLIGLTKSGFGSGIGLMIVPMMALAVPHCFSTLSSQAALPLLLPLLVCGDFIAVYQYRRIFSLKIVRKLILATILGVLVGGVVIYEISQHKRIAGALVMIDIGFESVLLVSLHWYRVWKMSGNVEAYVPRTWHNQVVGMTAGISSTIAHAAGPIVAVYLLPQKMERKLFVGTCAIYFFILNTIKLPVYWKDGQFGQVSPAFALMFLPLVICGAVFGFWINKRLSDKLFSNIVYVATFILGAYLLYKGVVDLKQR
jgi:hypothetical protein